MSRREYYQGVKMWSLGDEQDPYYSDSLCQCGGLPGLRFEVTLLYSEHVTVEDSCCLDCFYWLNEHK